MLAKVGHWHTDHHPPLITVPFYTAVPVTYTSCVDAQSQGQSSGYTLVQPLGLSTAYELWCNQDDYGGGEE